MTRNQQGTTKKTPEKTTERRFQMDYTLLRISNTYIFIMAHKTFFGLRFSHFFIKRDDPSSEKGYKLDPSLPIINPEQLKPSKPLMIYPRLILQNRSTPISKKNSLKRRQQNDSCRSFWDRGRQSSGRNHLLYLIGDITIVWK